MNRDILQELGLSERESVIYRTLLRLGESPIGDVIQSTKLHPQLVYRALEALKSRGLVIETYRRHRKYVQAEDPNALTRQEEERLVRLKETIPALLALSRQSKDAVVRVAKGNEALRKTRLKAMDEIPDGGEYLVIGATGDRFFETMQDVYDESERKRVKKKIKRKLLTYLSQKSEIEAREKYPKGVEIRYLDGEYSAPASTIIFNNTVSLQLWLEEPVVINIESKEAAESYRHYFEALWQIAKPG